MTEPDEWSCGHVAGSVCAECYQNLAVRANTLANENMWMRQQQWPLRIPDAAVSAALNQMLVDLTYRTPGLEKPLAHIVLTREQAEAIVKWAAGVWPR